MMGALGGRPIRLACLIVGFGLGVRAAGGGPFNPVAIAATVALVVAAVVLLVAPVGQRRPTTRDDLMAAVRDYTRHTPPGDL